MASIWPLLDPILQKRQKAFGIPGVSEAPAPLLAEPTTFNTPSSPVLAPPSAPLPSVNAPPPESVLPPIAPAPVAPAPVAPPMPDVPAFNLGPLSPPAPDIPVAPAPTPLPPSLPITDAVSTPGSVPTGAQAQPGGVPDGQTITDVMNAAPTGPASVPASGGASAEQFPVIAPQEGPRPVMSGPNIPTAPQPSFGTDLEDYFGNYPEGVSFNANGMLAPPADGKRVSFKNQMDMIEEMMRAGLLGPAPHL